MKRTLMITKRCKVLNIGQKTDPSKRYRRELVAKNGDGLAQ